MIDKQKPLTSDDMITLIASLFIVGLAIQPHPAGRGLAILALTVDILAYGGAVFSIVVLMGAAMLAVLLTLAFFRFCLGLIF